MSRLELEWHAIVRQVNSPADGSELFCVCVVHMKYLSVFKVAVVRLILLYGS